MGFSQFNNKLYFLVENKLYCHDTTGNTNKITFSSATSLTIDHTLGRIYVTDPEDGVKIYDKDLLILSNKNVGLLSDSIAVSVDGLKFAL